MNLDEMRQLDAVKTYKELEESKRLIADLNERIDRMKKAGDNLMNAAFVMGWREMVESWIKAKEAKL